VSIDSHHESPFQKGLREAEERAKQRLFQLQLDIDTDFELLGVVTQKVTEWYPVYLEALKTLETQYLEAVGNYQTDRAKQAVEAQYLRSLERLENTGPSTRIVTRITSANKRDDQDNQDDVILKPPQLPPRT
jgi:hypothetical protein